MRYAVTAVTLILATSAWAQELSPIDQESKYVLPSWADVGTAPHWGGMPMAARGDAYHGRTSGKAEFSNTRHRPAPAARAQSTSTYVPPAWADTSAAPHWGGTPMQYRGGADSGFSRTGG